MEAFIIELLEKYKYKKYDDNFIKEFIDFAIKNYHLEDYVEKSEVKMFNEPGECYIAVYYYLEKSITVYRDRLDDLSYELCIKVDFSFISDIGAKIDSCNKLHCKETLMSGWKERDFEYLKGYRFLDGRSLLIYKEEG